MSTVSTPQLRGALSRKACLKTASSRLFSKWSHPELLFKWSHLIIWLPELVNWKFNLIKFCPNWRRTRWYELWVGHWLCYLWQFPGQPACRRGFYRPPEEAGNTSLCLSEVSLIYCIVVPITAETIGSNPADTRVGLHTCELCYRVQ